VLFINFYAHLLSKYTIAPAAHSSSFDLRRRRVREPALQGRGAGSVRMQEKHLDFPNVKIKRKLFLINFGRIKGNKAYFTLNSFLTTWTGM